MDLVLVLITITISLIAYFYINNIFTKYKKKKASCELSGFEVARKILDKYDLNEVYITEVKGKYSDNYNDDRKVVRLSKNIFHGNSITSIKEIQRINFLEIFEKINGVEDHDKKPFYKYRSIYYKVTNFLALLGLLFIVFGIFFDLKRYNIILLGIVFEIITLLMYLLTLKVEFECARRTLDELLDLSIIRKEENDSIKSVLAACCYKNIAFLVNNITEFFITVYHFGKSD